jgi:enterochelin esterase-like enzyme
VALQIYSPALHARRKAFVYLPPGYFNGARRGHRYPVLYLLQASVGQAGNYLQVGDLNVRMDMLIQAHRVRPFIVVMPGGHGPDHEWANADAGNFESYVLDVVHAIDSRYSTLANRRGRGIAGLSEGGYGAANIALRNLGRFSVFESWSGYYAQTPAFPFSGLSAATIAANSPRVYVPSLRAKLRRLPVHAFLYVGNHEGLPPSLTIAFAHELRAAGAQVNWAVYGGGHNWGLWRAHFSHMLVFAGRSFSP